MKLIEFMQNTTNPIKELESRYGIISKRHFKYSNLVLFKYDQINSPMEKEIVKECRGIILDEANNWNIVCRSFNKFFNSDDVRASKIDLNNARVYEKLDGSLCQLYYYDDKWNVATSGTPDACGNVGDFNKTFEDLFWETWYSLNYTLPTNTNTCYAFELMTPFNIVVIQHQESSIALIGARDLITQKELNPVVEAHQNGWNCVKIFNFEDDDAVKNMLKNMNGSDQEGFVVCDTTNYNRVKMKCDDYVVKHRLVSSMSMRNMLDAVRINEGDEILLHAPQFKELYWEIKCKYSNLIGQIEGFYNAIKHIDDRKQFALRAKDQKFSGILFGLKHGKINNIKQGIANMNIKVLEQWLDLKEIIS